MDRDATACEICRRIDLIKGRENQHFVAELKTGYVVIGDHQLFRGYTLFLYKEHKEELHELDADTKRDFLLEMSAVAEAVGKAFQPDKLNYELLGNKDPHLHWRIFPRFKNDAAPGRPVASIPREIFTANTPSETELEELKALLRASLKTHIPA